jgi:hypothetical protein
MVAEAHVLAVIWNRLVFRLEARTGTDREGVNQSTAR